MKKSLLFLAVLMAFFISNDIMAQTDSCSFSGVHYTDAQDAKCLECLVNNQKFRQKIEKLELAKVELIQWNADQLMEIEQLRDQNMSLIHQVNKLERKKNIWRSVVFGCVSIIAIETVVILIK